MASLLALLLNLTDGRHPELGVDILYYLTNELFWLWKYEICWLFLVCVLIDVGMSLLGDNKFNISKQPTF